MPGRRGILKRLRQASPPASLRDSGDKPIQSARRSPTVLFYGLLPPPLDGQRIVTKLMLDRLARVTPVSTYNLHPDRGRSGSAGLEKLICTLRGLPWMFARRLRGCKCLYLAPYSGRGIAYACMLATAARVLRFRIFVHYHSSMHFARFSWLMAAFLWICGGEAVHIVLAPQMGTALRRLYGSEKQTFVLSNSAFFDASTAPRRYDRQVLRVGHLSNLSLNKGIDRVVECAEQFERRGLNVELVLAGPVDVAARGVVDGALSTLKRVRYLGPLVPTEVARFYEEIDVFLFPTRHAHEAEPLVVLDALTAGVPVIASDSGYLRHVLGETSGCLVAGESFVERSVEKVGIWSEDRQALAQASCDARGRAAKLRQEAQDQLSRLLQRVTTQPGGDVADSNRHRRPWFLTSLFKSDTRRG